MSTSLGSKAERALEALPSNQEIEKGLDKVRKEIHAVRTAPGIDATGHRILSDTEQVLTSAEILLREKNEGDKLQRILQEGQKASAELQHQAEILRSTGVPSVDTEHLRELAEKTLETARLAGMELVSSNSFRKSLSDFLLLCYDIIADTTTETIPSKKKGKEKLTSKKRGRTAKPITTTTTRTTEVPYIGPTVTTTAVPEPTSLPTPAPVVSTPTFPTTTAPPVSVPTRFPTTAPVLGTAGAATATAISEGDSLKDQAKEGIEGAINKGLEVAGTDQRVHLSKEQINELVDRFIDLMKNISQRERTRKVFIGLMDMFKLFGKQVTGKVGGTEETVVLKAERSANAVRYNKHVVKTLDLSRELFEQFTGDKTLDTLIYHLRKVDKGLRKDKDTRDYFHDLRIYVVDLLNHPELFDDPETGRRGRRLIKRGRKLHDRKLWVHLRGIVDESRVIITNIQHDPATRKLRQDMKRLIQDIMLDEQGNVVLKEHVLQQLRLIIVSSLVERMRLPLPPVHLEDKDMEYTLKNLVVSIRDLVPERVVMESRGRLALDLADVRAPEVERASNTIRLVIQNINIHMEQADIAFHRKTFPKVTDHGQLRMDIGGKGMDLIIQLQTYVGARDFFRVEFVDCDVHSLDFYLQDTRHDWLYNSVLKLLSGRIKRNMESSIENMLRNHLEQLNRMLLKQLRKAKGLTPSKEATTSKAASLTSAIKTGASLLTGNSFNK